MTTKHDITKYTIILQINFKNASIYGNNIKMEWKIIKNTWSKLDMNWK